MLYLYTSTTFEIFEGYPRSRVTDADYIAHLSQT